MCYFSWSIFVNSGASLLFEFRLCYVQSIPETFVFIYLVISLGKVEIIRFLLDIVIFC